MEVCLHMVLGGKRFYPFDFLWYLHVQHQAGDISKTKQGGGMDQKKNNPQKPEANGKKSVDQSRRKALKRMAAGTAVAGALAISSKWSKPVVNSIILPAHAQATNAEAPANTTTTTTTTTANPNEER
ncbi:MAG TPA: twin-arginine translocation signal domain-containing protein [Desulfobulbus sp.]|nr:twin-arginine translocation signal domain-containing protein [Desulfobulbus sp.]